MYFVSVTKSTPEIPSGFSDLKSGRAWVAGYAVYKITGLAGKLAMDGKGASWSSYLGFRTDVRTGVATWMLTGTPATLTSSCVVS